jgi:MFS family permease
MTSPPIANASFPPVGAAFDLESTYSKITRRFVPLFFIAYLFNYMDRTNIGFAQLQMKGDLGFSDAIYGIGAGIVFVSYTAFGLPSNLVLVKIGARKTLLGCLVGWGLCSMLTMFVRTPHEFYVIRFLIGAFEAGFFPGVIYYFSQWYPLDRRGKVTGIFSSATAVAGVVSGLISGPLMQFFDGHSHLRGWQWLFLIEGLPSIALGIFTYFYLQDKPAEARWLSAEEKQLVSRALQKDTIHGTQPSSVWQVLYYWRVYLLGFIFFLAITDTYVLAFWQPLLIRDFGVHGVAAISLYSTIPAIGAVVAKLGVPYLSDLKRERRWHFAISAILGACALSLTTIWPHNLVLGMFLLTVATAGAHATIPVFWSVPGQYLSGQSAASGIAIISMIGTLGGVVGPPMLGFIKQMTGSYAGGMYLQSALLVLGAVLMLTTVAKLPPSAESTSHRAS